MKSTLDGPTRNRPFVVAVTVSPHSWPEGATDNSQGWSEAEPLERNQDIMQPGRGDLQGEFGTEERVDIPRHISCHFAFVHTRPSVQ